MPQNPVLTVSTTSQTNQGPASSASTNTVAVQAGTTGPAAPLAASLPPPTADGQLGVTTDQGIFVSKGGIYVPQTNGAAIVTSRGRPVSIGWCGDSVCARNNFNLDLATVTVAQSYASTGKAINLAYAWIAQAAMRSNYSYYQYEYGAAGSGFTTAQVLSICLPALLGYPNGLPDMCIVQGSGNDQGILSVAQTLANNKTIAQTLLSKGVLPIFVSILPQSGSLSYFQQLNFGLLRLAKEFGCPYVPWFPLMANASTGGWQNANWNIGDNLHPSPAGAAIMGYILNQALQSWIPQVNRVNMDSATGALSNQQVYENFTGITGTVNTASSYPTDWGAPGTPAMSTIFNQSGTEPGTGSTPLVGVPSIGGGLGGTPYLLGNSWSMAGNGTNTLSSTKNANIQINPGDRVSFSMRIKMISGTATASPNFFQLSIAQASVQVFGAFWQNLQGTSATNANLGDETALPAMDYYAETTFNGTTVANGFALGLFFSNNTFSASNSGDSLTFANIRMVNLTQLGLIAP